jgi:hypothetical protein
LSRDAALDAREQASPVDAVAAATRQLGAALGTHSASFLVADRSGRALVRLTHLGHRCRGGGPVAC